MLHFCHSDKISICLSSALLCSPITGTGYRWIRMRKDKKKEGNKMCPRSLRVGETSPVPLNTDTATT